MERLEPIGPLAGPEERDRQSGCGPNAERRTATGVAVHLGEDEAGDRQLGVERLRHADRLLSRHRVDDQERLGRGDAADHTDQLVHHRLVDVQAAGGVENHDVDPALARDLEPRARDLERRGPHRPGVDLHADLVAQLHELVDGRRSVDVRGHQERLAAILAQTNRQLGGRGRLS